MVHLVPETGGAHQGALRPLHPRLWPARQARKPAYTCPQCTIDVGPFLAQGTRYRTGMARWPATRALMVGIGPCQDLRFAEWRFASEVSSLSLHDFTFG
jgi:hypothetical protein